MAPVVTGGRYNCHVIRQLVGLQHTLQRRLTLRTAEVRRGGRNPAIIAVYGAYEKKRRPHRVRIPQRIVRRTRF